MALALVAALAGVAAASDGGVDPSPVSTPRPGAVPIAKPVVQAAPSSPPWSAPLPLLFEAGLGADTDLVLLPPAGQPPPPRPTVTAVTRVAAIAPAVRAILLSPSAFRQALPSLIRADVTAQRAGPRPDAWPDRLLAWEVEIPLFNLTGHAWLKQRPDGADLELIDGAFAPGEIRLRATATTDGRSTVLTCQMRIEVRSSNWIFRRVARHDPWAEAAMSAATGWVLARALALRAESPPGTPPARPRDVIQPPAVQTLDAAFLAAPPLAGLRSGGVLAAIRRARNGRLAWSGVAVPVAGSPTTVASRLATPEKWGVFPGWKSIKRRPANNGFIVLAVDDNVALVDLDAVWLIDPKLPGRATAIEGATRNAVFAWQTAPGDNPHSSIAILSMHPHLDAAGLVERKFIAAEPLLEHALALALAYVDASAIAESFSRAAPPPAVVPAVSP